MSQCVLAKNTVYPRSKAPGLWTTQRNIRLFGYVKDGKSNEQIGIILGFRPTQIQQRRALMFPADT